MSEKDQTQRGVAAGAEVSEASPASVSRRKRILLVEDEPLTRLILLSKLRLAGFDVDVAWNGTLALEKLRAHRPDAMFLDLMLPDIKGVDVIKEARQDKVFSTRPIYVCTSAALMSVWSRRALKAGATKVFNKGSTPVNDIVTEVTEDLLGGGARSPQSAGRQVAQEASVKLLENVGTLCTDVEQIAKCEDNEIRVAKCDELRDKIRTVFTTAGAEGLHPVARVAAALDAFLKEICEKAKKVTDASLNAIYSALEVMGQLCHSNPAPAEKGEGPAADGESGGYTAVVVDNDLVSRTAVSNALRNAGLKPITFGNPTQAIEHLKSHPADLIIVDASVSEQAGLDLRNQVGEIQSHKDTPVMVVATPRTVKRATRTASKNQTEFVAKPYTPMELSLKALSTVLKNRTASKPAEAGSTTQAASRETPPPVPGATAKASVAAATPAANGPRGANAPQRSRAETFAQVTSQLSGVPDLVFKKGPASTPESGQPAEAGPSSSESEGVVIEFNDLFQIVSATTPCPAFFGWECEELVGRELATILKGGLNNGLGRFVQQSDAAARGAERPEFDVIVCRKDASEASAIVTLEPLPQGSQLCWLATFRSSAGATGAPASAHPFVAEAQGTPGQSTALAEALRRLQHSQATLQSANEELHKQFEAISAQAATQREEIDRKEKERAELVARIYSNEVEIKRVKTSLEKEAEDRKQAEASLENLTTSKTELERQLSEAVGKKEELLESCGELRGQLEEAKSAAAEADLAAKKAGERAHGMEEEAVKLRGEHAELLRQIATEQQAATEARRKMGDLETRVQEQAAEIERAKSELQKQTAAWQQKEAESREQIATAKAATEKAEAAWVEESDRAKRLSEEIANLTKQRDGQGSVESDLRQQLNAAKAAAERAESARKEETGRCVRLETELAAVQRTRDELNQKTSSEEQALVSARQRAAGLEKDLRERDAELARVKAELKQQAAAQNSADSAIREQLAAAEAALKEKSAQSSQVESVLAALRQERDDLHGRYNGEQQAAAAAKRRVKDLEKQLRDSAAGFAAAKVELEKRATERSRVESELRAENEKAAQAGKEEAARRTKLEEQLVALRQEQEALQAKLSAGQQTAEESKRRVEELEQRLRESAAELGRAKAVAQNQTEMQTRAAASGTKADSTEEDFGREICRLRENEAAHLAELSELERRVRDSVASLARVTAELEKERAERRRVEHRCATLGVQMQELHVELKQHLESEKATQLRLTDLEQQLQERGEAINRTRAELHKEAADRQLAEEQLRAAGDMSAQLRKYLSLFDESKKVFKRAQEDLEAKLQASHAAVSEVESKLQKETSERQRLDDALQAAQRDAQEQSQKTSIELAKLQSALQVEQFERQRVAGDAIQSRYASLDSTRAGRAHVTTFCRLIHEPVETVMQSTRRLLETDLNDAQKKLVEAVLENTLVVQTNLNESGSLASAPSRGAASDVQVEATSPRGGTRAEKKPAGKLQP